MTYRRPKTVEPPVGTLSGPRGCSSQRVRRLSRRLSQHFDGIVAASGLKTTQYSLLSAVAELGPVPPGLLAEAMDLDASTLTRNLRPLVVAGWIELGLGQDQRSRLVSCTAAGRAKRTEGRQAWKRAQLALNERLGEAAVMRLHDVVDECLALLGDRTGAAPAAATLERKGRAGFARAVAPRRRSATARA